MNTRRIAYFSMEIAVHDDMPTYSGGLGLLSGDTVRAAADMRVPIVAVTLLHRKGYFRQQIDPDGTQRELPAEWQVEKFLQPLNKRIVVRLENRDVCVRAWQYEVTGGSAFMVPVFFLDTDLPENDPRDRVLTHHLYGGDDRYRLCQEVVLGIGGVRMLRALGGTQVQRFHMNEGHASLLTLELLDEQARADKRTAFTEQDVEAVRRQCVFTTHTPVPAGLDQFPMDLVKRVLGARPEFDALCRVFRFDGSLNMTYLGLNLSHYINGVAKRHGEVSSLMFAPYRIDAITNGVHAATWTAPAFQTLFDAHIPGWRGDNFSLRYAMGIDLQAVWEAHRSEKRRLLARVRRETKATLDPSLLTIGFARRATGYKRGDLVFRDLERLRRVAAGKVQFVFAGKAHPNDETGKEIIRHIFQARDALGHDVPVVYLPEYDWQFARLLVAGVDLWLNTPRPPMEASGTSGMKAALNGVPSLSILDGWWLEGCIEGKTGWGIGPPRDAPAAELDESDADAAALCQKLEQTVLPLFQRADGAYIEVMRYAIALNGSFFNTQRMMQQYVLKAYFE